MQLLEKFFLDEQKKPQSIAELSKAVLDLAEEVRKLKEGERRLFEILASEKINKYY